MAQSSRQCVACGHVVSVRERVTNVTFVLHKRCLRCARCGRLAEKIFYEGSKIITPEQIFCSQTCLLSPSLPSEPEVSGPKVVLKPLLRDPAPKKASPPSLNEPPPPSLNELPPSSLLSPPTVTEPPPLSLSTSSLSSSTHPSSHTPSSSASSSPPTTSSSSHAPLTDDKGPLVDPALSLAELQQCMKELENEESVLRGQLEKSTQDENTLSSMTLDVALDHDEVSIRKAGWVMKKGGGKRRSNWTKRYLILRLSRAAYYTKDVESDKSLKGTIDISAHTSVRLNDLRMDGRGFQIVTPDRTYFINASSKSDCDAWIAAFSSMITQKKKLDELRDQGKTGSIFIREKSVHMNKLRSVQKERLALEKEHQKCLVAIDTIRHHIAQSSSSSNDTSPGSKPPVAISVDGIPQGNPVDWSVQQVTQWLHFVGLGEFAPCFAKNLISGLELLDLTCEDLDDLGITKASTTEHILKEIDQHR